MPFSTTSYPIAHKRHRCTVCLRVIMVGERYNRSEWIEKNRSATAKYCDQCDRLVMAYQYWDGYRGDDEFDLECFYEWAQDEFPLLWTWLNNRWTYPDGELYSPDLPRRSFHERREF